MLLKGKTVLVTGGAQGIGKEIIMACLEEGASIHYIDLAEGPHRGEMDEAAKKTGATVGFTEGNITDEGQVTEMIGKIVENGVDVLVNNAGITRDGLSFRMPLEQWEMVIKVNLTGAFLVGREVSRYMIKNKKGVGSIINMASIVGQMGNLGQTNYSASKAGLIGYTKSLAKEVASRGVRVNAVAPGFIKTAMTEKLSDEVKTEYAKAIPLGRMGEASDVANAVVFLASDLSSYMTGQVIRVDGGMVM